MDTNEKIILIKTPACALAVVVCGLNSGQQPSVLVHVMCGFYNHHLPAVVCVWDSKHH